MLWVSQNTQRSFSQWSSFKQAFKEAGMACWHYVQEDFISTDTSPRPLTIGHVFLLLVKQASIQAATSSLSLVGHRSNKPAPLVIRKERKVNGSEQCTVYTRADSNKRCVLAARSFIWLGPLISLGRPSKEKKSHKAMDKFHTWGQLAKKHRLLF